MYLRDLPRFILSGKESEFFFARCIFALRPIFGELSLTGVSRDLEESFLCVYITLTNPGSCGFLLGIIVSYFHKKCVCVVA